MQFKESRKIIESIFRKRKKKSIKQVDKKELQSKAASEASLMSKAEGQQKTNVPKEPAAFEASLMSKAEGQQKTNVP